MSGTRPTISRRGVLLGGAALMAAGCRPSPPAWFPRPGRTPADATSATPTARSVVVPYAPGGTSDQLLRLAADFWPRGALPLHVRNVTGSNGSIGARVVHRAAPDGYTLLAAHESLLTSYYLGLTPYSWQDYEPVAGLFFLPELIVTRKNLPWKDVPSLLDDARRRPEQITWAATFGSRSHFLPGEIMCRADVRFKLVGYDGTAACLAALQAGEVDVANASLGAVQAANQDGKLRLIASAGLRRPAALPDLPTVREQGLDVGFSINLGLLAPKGTPPAVLDEIEALAAQSLAEPELQQRAIDEFHADPRYLPRATYVDRMVRLDGVIRTVVDTLGLRASAAERPALP